MIPKCFFEILKCGQDEPYKEGHTQVIWLIFQVGFKILVFLLLLDVLVEDVITGYHRLGSLIREIYF